jgi:hypothetical protein
MTDLNSAASFPPYPTTSLNEASQHGRRQGAEILDLQEACICHSLLSRRNNS